MLQMNWSVVDTTHPKRNKLAMGAKIKATGELKLKDSHADNLMICFYNYFSITFFRALLDLQSWTKVLTHLSKTNALCWHPTTISKQMSFF